MVPLLGSASLRHDAIKSQGGAFATKNRLARKRSRDALADAAVNVLISESYAIPLVALFVLRADHLDPEIANFLAQSVAVKPQKVGRANLVSAGRHKRRRDQRQFDFLQDAAVEAGGRQLVAEAHEVVGKVTLDRLGKIARRLRGVGERGA